MTLIDGTPSPVPIAPASEPLAGGNYAVVPKGSGTKIWVAILLVYLIAFALPVFADTGILANHLGVRPNGSVYGWQAFLVGLFMQRTGWFANLAIWTGIVLLARGRLLLATVAGLVAVGLGSMYLSILADHSLVSPQSFSVGYFCWLASAVLVAGAGLGLRLFGPGRASLIFATVTGATGVAALVTVAHYIIVMTAPPSEATLADRLISGDVAARRAAARKLALDHKPELIPVFIRAANDPDDKVRQLAIGGLGDIGPAAVSAVPTLIAVLSTPFADPPTGRIDRKRAATSRSAAAAALGNLGPVAKGAVPALSAALKDENVPVRRWSATSLGEMGPAGRPAIPALLAALGDADVQVRRYAIQSLMKIGPGPDCVPQLSTCLHDGDITVRETAAALVKSLKKPQ
jgi:HEAT repeat protein